MGFWDELDAAERAQLLKIIVYFVPACFIMLSALWFFLHQRGAISSGVLVVLLVLNLPLTALGVVAIHVGTSRASVGLVKTLYSAIGASTQ